MNIQRQSKTIDIVAHNGRTVLFFVRHKGEPLEVNRSGFLSSGTGDVLVRLYPGTDIHVEMPKNAAAHLLRLLERYNWTLSEPSKKSDRWRKFWPKITVIERQMVSMFVISNNHGQFRGRVRLRPLPPEVADGAEDTKLVKLSAEVEHEFMSLRHIFVQTLVSVDDLKVKWHETHLTVMQAHGAVIEKALHSWRSGDGSIDLNDFLRTALFAGGMPEDEAKQTAAYMHLEAMWLTDARQDALCEQLG